jgi:hypothetical protein
MEWAGVYEIAEFFTAYPEISKLWKQTGKLQYKVCANIKQNCDLIISKKEFYNYLLSFSEESMPKNFTIFVTHDNINIDAIHDKFLEKEGV